MPSVARFRAKEEKGEIPMKKLTAALLVFLMMVMTGAMALAYTEGT